MSEQTQLANLTLEEIADRIDRHLKRIEREHNEPRGTRGELSKYFLASAVRFGAYVHVTYVNYQGGTNLTRAEALHYLAALDRGFVGTHYEYFRQNPPPTQNKPDVQYTALIRDRDKFALYAVTRRTPTRVYGHQIAGNGYFGSWVDRHCVLKLQATQEDLERVLEALQRKQDEINAARERFEVALREIIGKEPEIGDEHDRSESSRTNTR